MIRIGVVYNTVRDLCNKDQKGFVTPAVFNTLAEVAQMNIYNEMFNELKLMLTDSELLVAMLVEISQRTRWLKKTFLISSELESLI